MPEHTQHGPLTHELSTALLGNINHQAYALFIDPHRGNEHLQKPAQNVHVLAHLGAQGTHATGLSQCDIMIATNEGRRAVLLIEVEEGSKGTSPKTVLGDVFNIWMANAIRVRGQDSLYALCDTTLWIVVFEPEKGAKGIQYDGLQLQLDRLRTGFQELLHDRVQVTATRIVRVKHGSESMVEAVLARIRDELPDLLARPQS